MSKSRPKAVVVKTGATMQIMMVLGIASRAAIHEIREMALGVVSELREKIQARLSVLKKTPTPALVHAKMALMTKAHSADKTVMTTVKLDKVQGRTTARNAKREPST
jgi:hypothetical protein